MEFRMQNGTYGMQGFVPAIFRDDSHERYYKVGQHVVDMTKKNKLEIKLGVTVRL